MKLLHRIGYYFSGFFIGLIILFFFLSGKKTSCDYGPNARVLKDIRTKPRTFTPAALSFFNTKAIDTATVASILETGDVDFSESITHSDSCNVYIINEEKEDKLQKIQLQIINCDSLATISEARFFTE